ncbi:RNA polymerase sigma factor SigD [Cellulomonas chitinilytica]|uniref:RNA polymerase sigma factor SigD n=1 Tax=Cellulomonas chitinilytica TaxID=398759 RepID=A0A919P177_9CELL|nr:RNA polymerase sigma factor [Cellulomonas chitinilytica]GIG20267.1 RNA polymerase sigma factor SigD [Cellulomonas chitinilytica]
MLDRFDDVLAAARTGHGEAFESLYHDLVRPVAAYLRARGAPDVEDLTNEVFLAVFTGLPRFRGDQAHFRSWVFTIAHRRVVDAWRRRARTVATELVADPDPPACGSAEDDALALLATEGVVALLARLTDDQRDVLSLRVVADLTVEQTAAVLGKPVGAVKALQRRGLAAVRRIISREGVPL